MVKTIIKYSTILLILLSFKSFAQTFEVSATTDSIEYRIGDYINYRLEISYDQNVTYSLPEVKDSLNNLEFIRELPAMKGENSGRKNDILTFVFAKYDSVEMTIPSFYIPFRIEGDPNHKFAKVNPVDIIVVSLDVNAEQDIMDVKDPLLIGLDWLFILIVVLIILVLVSSGYLGYRFYKKKKAGEPVLKKVIIIPPHKEALKALYQLEEDKLWQQGKIKEYHSEITGIVRKYFEKRFGILALEMPSSELLDELKNINDAKSVLDFTREFLSNADMVKFAKFVPMPTVNDEMMKQAKEIVHQTKQEEASELVEEVQNV